MAKLTAKARRALPKGVFAGPGRSFPVPDKAHAQAAIMLLGKAPPAASSADQGAGGSKAQGEGGGKAKLTAKGKDR